MVIVGAGGLATQLIEDFVQLKMQDIVFWSEIETKYKFIGELYTIIKTDEEVKDHFSKVTNDFMLCVGTDKYGNRRKLSERFKQLGGNIKTYISPYSRISPYGTQFGEGTIILNQVNVEPGVIIGKECIVNKTANIAHGCIIGSYCEIGPGTIMTGEVELGDNVFIGTGAILYPRIKIGSNAVIAAGSIVTRNVPDYALVAGVAAEVKQIKKAVE